MILIVAIEFSCITGSATEIKVIIAITIDIAPGHSGTQA